MGNDFERIWRLSLPDDWHPGYFWCVTFRIPGGVQYVEALSAAIGLLTKTKTWARDDTREGAKTVAATWEEALYERPIDVQQLDCIWLGPVVSTPEDRANVSAAIIQQVFIYLIQTIIDAIAASQTKIDWIEARAAEWQWYGFNPSAAAQLGHLWDAVEALSPTERVAYAEDCVHIPEFTDLQSFMDANPFGWLNELASWLMDWLNSSADAVFDGLNGFAAMIGGSGVISYAYDHGGGGGGSTFGDECGWEHTWDFTVDDWGFISNTLGGLIDEATWIEGVGWFIDGASAQRRTVIVELAHASFDITSAEATCWTQIQTHGTSASILWDGNAAYALLSDPPAGNSVVETLTGHTLTVVGAGINSDASNLSAVAVVSITMRGTGLDPFA